MGHSRIAMVMGAIGACAAGFAPPARAELVFTNSYGIEFSTISDLGNPVVPQSVGPGFYPPHFPEPFPVGRVDYEYRISRTEITVERWAEFITAYRPFYTGGNPNFVPFTGFWIQWSSSQQQYIYDPAKAQYPTDASWRVAAAYCNWLHNDKANQAWAFESGAYDTTTFGQLPSGELTDQREHSPAAKFWIPTLDEWTKALHWDPDRYGQGQGGYWVYPTSSDEAPITGLPGVGQTNGGLPGAPNSSYFPVASYSDVQSPWGLYDGSGGLREWTELFGGEDRYRMTRGSAPGITPLLSDQIDWLNLHAPFGPGVGVRLAAAIPPPPTAVLFIAILACQRRSRT